MPQSLMKLEAFVERFGNPPDRDYLETHFSRFSTTQHRVYESWKWKRADILDLGAHWLYQSVLYAMDGHHVTAADLARPDDLPILEGIARSHGIDLYFYEDLSSEHALDGLADDSMDVILFCEILEHITFNPIGMWKAIYRILRPGGRIIITTPNFYRRRNMLDSIRRFLTGKGAGITVSEILSRKTLAPHWKEFSMKELGIYFEMLSRDITVQNSNYCSYRDDVQHLNWRGRLRYDWKNLFPPFREGLLIEVDLHSKQSGITLVPDW